MSFDIDNVEIRMAEPPFDQAQLQFPKSHIGPLSHRYVEELNDRDRKLTDSVTKEVFPSYRRKGFLTKDEFVTVCMWKSPRAKPHFESNEAALIREVSELSRKTKSEQMRIQIWTLLSGVKWPTASVFLHFALPNRYPILDVRALWSLGINDPLSYAFPVWRQYTDLCQSIAADAGVTMRELDQALWKYSQLKQGK